MSVHRKLILAAAILTTATILVSPAGAATTAWTSAHLTRAVKTLQTYVRNDRARDTRQAVRLTGLEATAAKQAKLNAAQAALNAAQTKLNAQLTRTLVCTIHTWGGTRLATGGVCVNRPDRITVYTPAVP
jgi:hypothetical protein